MPLEYNINDEKLFIEYLDVWVKKKAQLYAPVKVAESKNDSATIVKD